MIKTTVKAVYICWAMLLGAVLVATPAARAAEGTAGKRGLAVISVQNVEDKIDCVASFLRVEKEMDVPEDFKYASGMMDSVFGLADPSGNIQTEAQDPDIAVNEVIVNVAQNLLEDPNISQQNNAILNAFVAYIGEIPQGYCDPEAFEEERGPNFEPDGKFDPEDDDHRTPEPEPEPEPEPLAGNFEYYGKDNYILPDATSASNGKLMLADDANAPFIAPLVVEPANENTEVAPQAVSDPVVSISSNDFVRYAYNTGSQGETPVDVAQGAEGPYSATLHMDENSTDSDFIVFSYGNVYVPYGSILYVGIHPGDGTGDHPGQNEPRDSMEVDLSEQRGESLSAGENGEYTEIYQRFYQYGYYGYDGYEASENGDFDLIDSFLIFEQDGDNIYKVWAGTRNHVVDSLGLDARATSIDAALQRYKEDANLRNEVQAGDYIPGSIGEFAAAANPAEDPDFPGIEAYPLEWSGPYKYGVQTVGRVVDYGDGGDVLDYNNEVFHDTDRLQDNAMLAYLVQSEEHDVNDRMIEMAENRDELRAREALHRANGFGEIRARDAALTQLADAQSGRVTKDHNGNWVRAQQYVIRPDENTVQVLNVSARGQDASNPTQVSTMNFTVRARNSFPDQLWNNPDVPWSDYLNTKTFETDNTRYIEYYTESISTPILAAMSVEFKNENNGSEESLKESREFGEHDGSQLIKTEQLSLNGGNTPGIDFFNYFIPSNDPIDPGSPGAGDYVVAPKEGGFDYELNGGAGTINVALYEAYDMAADGDAYSTSENFQDMWDVLRVNEPGAANIGNMNLEISITNGIGTPYFTNPIEVVYIPMSRMLWKEQIELQ